MPPLLMLSFMMLISLGLSDFSGQSDDALESSVAFANPVLRHPTYVHLYRIFTPDFVTTSVYPKSTVKQIREIIKILQEGVHGRWSSLAYHFILWTNHLDADVKNLIELELNVVKNIRVSVREINSLTQYGRFEKDILLFESRGMTEFVTEISVLLAQYDFGGLSIGRYTKLQNNYSKPKKARYPKTVENIFSIVPFFPFVGFHEGGCCAPHRPHLKMFSNKISCYAANCGTHISSTFLYSTERHPIISQAIDLVKGKLQSPTLIGTCWHVRRELLSRSLTEAYHMSRTKHDLLLPPLLGMETKLPDSNTKISIPKSGAAGVLEIPVLATQVPMPTPPLCGSTNVDLFSLALSPPTILIDEYQSVYFEATFNRYYGIDFVDEALPSLQRHSAMIEYPVTGTFQAPLIPYSMHFLWAVNPNSPRGINEDDQQGFANLKKVTSSGRATWRYNLWTNRRDLIQSSTADMVRDGLSVRDFSELRNYPAFEAWIDMAIGKSWFGMATDLLKVIIVLQEGGFVADLDYRMITSPELLHLRAHSYFGHDAWEAINNGQYAACPGHPILVELLDVLSSNIGITPPGGVKKLPYLAQPLSCADTDIFGTAVLPLSLSVFKKFNAPGYRDVLLPPCMLHAGDFEHLYNIPRCGYVLRGGPNHTDLLQQSLGWQELLGSWTKFCLHEVVDIRNHTSPVLDASRDAWNGGDWVPHGVSRTNYEVDAVVTILFVISVILWMCWVTCLRRFRRKRSLSEFPV